MYYYSRIISFFHYHHEVGTAVMFFPKVVCDAVGMYVFQCLVCVSWGSGIVTTVFK